MLSIGQMSKICAVSVKTLRHYDKIGLLKPRYTDAANGYRYYEEDQIGTMLLIGRLKRYGFSLTSVQRMLETQKSGSLLKELSRQRLRLERQTAHLALTIREMDQHIKDFERTGDIMSYQNNYEISLCESSEQPILALRQNMSVEEFGAYYGKLFERITAEGLSDPSGVSRPGIRPCMQRYRAWCGHSGAGRGGCGSACPSLRDDGPPWALRRSSRCLRSHCFLDSHEWLGHGRSAL